MITLEQISDLGFKFQKASDIVYKEYYGIDYWIVSKELTKKISIQYETETGMAMLLKCDKEGTIKARMKIRDIDHMNEIIKFFEP